MFIIPSKYTERSPIFICLDAIFQFHPNERTIIYDSNSDDKTYIEKVKKYPNVIVSDYINPHRGAGSLWKAYEEYPNEHFYFLMQDSMLLKKSFDKFLYDDKTWNLMYFNEGPFLSRELNYATKVLSMTKYNSIPNTGHIGVFAAAGIYKQDIMKKFFEKGLHKALLPNDKFESQMKERIVGICLSQEEVDLHKYSVEGDYLAKVPQVVNNQLEYFQKIFLGRQ